MSEHVWPHRGCWQCPHPPTVLRGRSAVAHDYRIHPTVADRNPAPTPPRHPSTSPAEPCFVCDRVTGPAAAVPLDMMRRGSENSPGVEGIRRVAVGQDQSLRSGEGADVIEVGPPRAIVPLSRGLLTLAGLLILAAEAGGYAAGRLQSTATGFSPTITPEPGAGKSKQPRDSHLSSMFRPGRRPAAAGASRSSTGPRRPLPFAGSTRSSRCTDYGRRAARGAAAASYRPYRADPVTLCPAVRRPGLRSPSTSYSPARGRCPWGSR
jgi:hypothetical protein